MTTIRNRCIPSITLACLALLLAVAPWTDARAQRGGLAISRNLAQLVENAGTIVHGYVVAARVEPHPEFSHLYTVVVTLEVKDVLKGRADKTFDFRQYIWDIRDREDAAGYQKSQELVLFLTRPSEAGLSSPVGLAQGRFRVLRDEEKNEWVVNGTDNQGLLRDLLPALRGRDIPLTDQQFRLLDTHKGGAIPLRDFRNLVRLLSSSN